MDKIESSEFEIRRQLLQMEMLYQIGVALSESLDLRHVAQEILNRAVVMVDARGGLLLVKDQEEGPLKMIARLGLAGEEDELHQLLQLQALGSSWEKKEVRQEKGALGHYLCVVPLESRREVRGLLVMADKEHRDGAIGPFGESDEKLLRSFAYQAGAALQNARLHSRLQEAYEQLKAAQEKLAQLEQLRALGDVAVEVAHELNHILTTIMGRADVFLNFRKNPAPAMQTIFEAARQGMEIVERIQRFTQLGVGQQRAAVDLEALIRETIAQTQWVWKERGQEGTIDWQLQLQPLPSVQANATELKEVVANLLLNALEAMPSGGRLQVGARPVAEGIEIEVRDTGIGMSPDLQKRIFGPLFHHLGGRRKGTGPEHCLADRPCAWGRDHGREYPWTGNLLQGSSAAAGCKSFHSSEGGRGCRSAFWWLRTTRATGRSCARLPRASDTRPLEWTGPQKPGRCCRKRPSP